MEEKALKRISDKAFNFFAGLCLILLSIVLAINVGYIGKALSFAFVYLLGMGAYALYAFICLEGFFIMFSGSGIKAKFSGYFFCVLLIILGGLGLVTYFAVDQTTLLIGFQNIDGKSFSMFDRLSDIFKAVQYKTGVIDSYFAPTPLNIFFGINEFGCGFVGYAVLAAGNLVFNTSASGYIISFAAICLGVALIIIPLIVKAIIKHKKNAPKVEKKPKIVRSTGTASYAKTRVKNINVIKGAKNIDPKNYHSEVSGTGNSIEKFEEEHIDGFVKEQFGTNGFEEAIFAAPSSGNVSKPAPEKAVISESIFKVESDSKPIGEVVGEKEPEPEKVIAEEPIREDIIVKAPIIEEKPLENVATEPLKVINEAVFANPVVEEKPFEEAKPEPIIPPQIQPEPVLEEQQIDNEIVFEEPKVANQEAKPEPVKPKIPFKVLDGELLDVYETSEAIDKNSQVAEARKESINGIFGSFGIGAEVVDYTIGSSITRFNVAYKPNVSSKVVGNIVDDIAIHLGGVNVRFEPIIEGQSTSGLELPNAVITTVSFKDIYNALPDVKKHPLAIGFGKNIKGDVVWADFDEFPHLLIAGTTGSGKSVFVNSIICTLIMRNSPDSLKLVLVDPKRVEMSRYEGMPHLLTPIITEPKKVKVCLNKLCDEMNERYDLFSKSGATNISEYNEDCAENGNKPLPYIFVILDEYAALVEACKDISEPVVSLAALARACGIHILLATQRPSTDVVTGVIKSNIPAHVALATANSTHSQTIIGEGGAEKLLGKGDMLVQSPVVSRVGVTRLQGCFINRKEMARVIAELKSKYPTEYDEKFTKLEEDSAVTDFDGANFEGDNDGGDEETKYQSIKEWVMANEYMSISKIQRDCGVGFNRAGRFFNRMRAEGIVSLDTEGNKGSRVLISNKFGTVDPGEVTSIDNSYIKK